MNDKTILGLELELDEDDDCQPLAALVVIKYFEPDSEVSVGYMVRATSGLSNTEALGMAGLAKIRITENIKDGT